MSSIHPTIQLFEQHAELLEMQGSKAGLDDAIVQLAAWMNLARPRLTEDDWTALCELGAMLYHEGMRRRATGGNT
ncbi:MAG: hypothetical protein RR715_00250 [Comamonas sp.]